MARPLSEAKRQAILDAAVHCIAASGMSVATARISKQAGLAEGTLFTYFPTKDALFREAILDIEEHLATRLNIAESGDARTRVRAIWDSLIDWSLAFPDRRRALAHLKIAFGSDADINTKGAELFRDARMVVESGLSGHADHARLPFLIDTIFFGLSDVVAQAIGADTSTASFARGAGFDLFWNGAAA